MLAKSAVSDAAERGGGQDAGLIGGCRQSAARTKAIVAPWACRHAGHHGRHVSAGLEHGNKLAAPWSDRGQCAGLLRTRKLPPLKLVRRRITRSRPCSGCDYRRPVRQTPPKRSTCRRGRDRIDQKWLQSLPSPLPENVVQALQRSGYKVLTQQELMPMPLKDGRRQFKLSGGKWMGHFVFQVVGLIKTHSNDFNGYAINYYFMSLYSLQML